MTQSRKNDQKFKSTRDGPTRLKKVPFEVLRDSDHFPGSDHESRSTSLKVTNNRTAYNKNE